MNSELIKGIIFDYGGTIDSRGIHWSEVIWDAYVACGVKVDKDRCNNCGATHPPQR